MGRAKKEERDQPNIGAPGTMDRMPQAHIPSRPSAGPQRSMLQQLKDAVSPDAAKERALKDAQNFGKSIQT